jgi:2-keto-4-pentenoate hydratase/2-oxohepta-3-ene-1,7-dioic acid hydratase in catechol pathway
MRLVRYGPKGAEKPGVLDAHGGVRDLSGIVPDIGGDVLLDDGLRRLSGLSPEYLPPVSGPLRLGPPVAGIGKIIGVGLNYRDHAAETKLPLPKEPTLFLKATSALAGPADDLLIPREARSVDWEVELGVVIGRRGVYIAEAAALAHVAGYCVGIDFSERDFQFHRGGQGFKGKSADTFAPLGPWLVTKDSVADPQALELRLSVNGRPRQHGTTREMIFPVRELVAYISRFMSLQSGDVILTGTPAGVAMGQDPPVYLAADDVVVASIDGLGTQEHRVVAGV